MYAAKMRAEVDDRPGTVLVTTAGELEKKIKYNKVKFFRCLPYQLVLENSGIGTVGMQGIYFQPIPKVLGLIGNIPCHLVLVYLCLRLFQGVLNNYWFVCL